MTDLILLATLLDGPKHGYLLKRDAARLLGETSLHSNLVYPLLRRFTTNRWVTRKASPGERGQTRQRYALTASGRRELIARLSRFEERDAASGAAFLVRVGLFDVLEAGVRQRILEHREKSIRLQEARFAGMEPELKDGYGREVVEHLRRRLRMELAWIARLRKRI